MGNKHWTEASPKKFAYRIASDFIEQLRQRMAKDGWTQRKLAKKLKVSAGRISQVLNNPGNLELETMIQWARCLGMKVSVIAYYDGDKLNERGPINAEVFRAVWENASRPTDMWAIKESASAATTANTVDSQAISKGMAWGQRGFAARGPFTTEPTPNVTDTFFELPIHVKRKGSTRAKARLKGVTPLREVQNG
jgi:transcriptional regulator with XRE-family HTH domain